MAWVRHAHGDLTTIESRALHNSSSRALSRNFDFDLIGACLAIDYRFLAHTFLCSLQLDLFRSSEINVRHFADGDCAHVFLDEVRLFYFHLGLDEWGSHDLSCRGADNMIKIMTH